MSTLTPEGQRLVDDLAQRHDFSTDAVTHMLMAIIAGQGRMAQFGHVEFGGNGQWMSGGMLMLGDMFNTGLKNRVDALCTDLSNALASAGPFAAPAQSQSQSQGQGDNGSMHLPDTPFVTSSTKQTWWPRELGTPSSSGSQNSMRYAWFADACRLVIDRDGRVTTYDTGNHHIGGFSQQQGGHDGMSMSSQFGPVDLAALPVVAGADISNRSVDGDDHQPPASSHEAVSDSSEMLSEIGRHGSQEPQSRQPEGPESDDRDDPLKLIERMGELRDRGLLTDEEFSAKKLELLSRL